MNFSLSTVVKFELYTAHFSGLFAEFFRVRCLFVQEIRNDVSITHSFDSKLAAGESGLKGLRAEGAGPLK